MNLKHYIYALTIIILISCSIKEDEESLIENYISKDKRKDTLKLRYENNSGKIKTTVYPSGEITKYYKNGNIFLKGFLNRDMERVSIWRFYSIEGKLSEVREYFILRGKSILNQVTYFDEEGYEIYYSNETFNRYDQVEYRLDTLKTNKSFFMDINLNKDTLYVDDYIKGACFYYTPLYGEKNSKSILIIGSEKNNFNSDFSNFNKTTKDTFYSLSIDSANKKYFPDDNPNYTIAFSKKYNNPGKKYLRGYLSEFYFDKEKNKKEVRIYFEKELIVLDTIKRNKAVLN